MSLLAWSDELSVHVEEMDAQHQRLVGMINQLHTALRQGQGEAATLRVVEEMKRYATTHFADEEKHLLAHDYPQFVAHKAEHEAFVKKVEQVERDCQAGKCTMSMEVLNFLSNWLVTHIKGTDRHYGPFLNERGVR